MPTRAERDRQQVARRRWAIYRQYLHWLSPEFMKDWGELRATAAPSHDTITQLRERWPEAPWDLDELRPDEFYSPGRDPAPPADPALLETWERHRKALEPPRRRRIKEPKAPLTMARQCFLEGLPWSDLPANSIFYRRLVVWNLRNPPPWVMRLDRALWEIATVLFPEDATVTALLETRDSIVRNDLKKKLTARMSRYLEEVTNDLATLCARPRKKGR